MYTEDLYQQYFEELATSCVDIGHAPGQRHFFMNMETGTALSELSAALKNKLRFPTLVLDESQLDSSGSGNPTITIIGGFSVLTEIKTGDIDTIRDARLKTKTIARKLINKMRRDSMAQFNEESTLLAANAVRLGEIKQYAAPIILNTLTGWCVEFTWLIPDDITFGIDDFIN